MCVATGINLDSGIPWHFLQCRLGVWKKSLIEVIQIKAIESLFFCGASDLVFCVQEE